MTKNFKSYILSALAVAAVALSGCSKNDEGMPEEKAKTFEVSLTMADTKTENNVLHTNWVPDDAINLFHCVTGASTPDYKNDGKFTTSSDSGTFTGDLAEALDDTKAYNWYAFYPYTSQITTPDKKDGYVTVGSSAGVAQVQEGYNNMSHLAGTNFPLAGTLEKYPGSEKPVINMRNLASVVRFKIKNATSEDIEISSVSLVTDGAKISGTYYIDFSHYTPVFTPSGERYVSNTATVNINSSTPRAETVAPNEVVDIYLGIVPFMVNEGDHLTVRISGTNGVCEKVISASKDYVFSPGSIKTINASYDLSSVTYDFTTVAELNAIAAEVGTTATAKFGKFSSAIVSFVPQTNTAIITDGTGSIMYYKSGHGLKQGQTFSGDVNVTVQNYNSLYSEITSIDATFEGDGQVVEPQNLALEQVIGHYATYQNAYVKMENLEVTEIDGKNISVKDGSNTYIVYLNSGTTTAIVGDKITAIGTITKHGTTEELKVWKSADIIITSHIAAKHAITFTQPAAGGSVKVTVGGSEITSGTEVMEGTEVKAEIVLTGGYNFTTWDITGAVNLSSKLSHVVTFEVGTEDITIKANLVSASSTTYTLTSNDIKAAHSSAWQYDSGKKTITATDGSVWTAYNTYGNTNQVTIQMNSGKGCYVLTPDVGTKKITKITIDLSTKADGTGQGTRNLIISKADGSSSATVSASSLISGYTPTVSESQLKIEPSTDGAVYIKSITIQFE